MRNGVRARDEIVAAPRAAGHQAGSPTRRASAFTLIELLVVISVILLLAALIMPAIQSALRSADRAKCVSNLSQIGKALVTYATSNANRLPFNRRAWCGWPRHWYARNAFDEDAVGGRPPDFDCLGRLYDGGMIEDPEVFYCPADAYVTNPGLARWQEARRTHKGADINCSYTYRGTPSPPNSFSLATVGTHAIAREQTLYVHGWPWINVLHGDGSVVRFSNQAGRLKSDYYNDSLYEDWEALDSAPD